MKIYTNKINQLFLYLDAKKIEGVLLFGPNENLIASLCKKIKLHLGLEVRLLSGSDVLKNDNLRVILSSSNLLASRELIQITDSGSALDSKSGQILAENQNHFVVIIAKELTASSTLRKFFEASTKLVAIACYEDDKNNMIRYVADYMKEANKKIHASAVEYLVANVASQENLTNELNKLQCYFWGEADISLADIEHVFVGSSTTEIDLLCISLINNHTTDYFTKLDSVDFNILVPMVAVRSFIRCYHNMYYLLIQKQRGYHFEDTARGLKAPIFFKHLPLFIQATSKQNITKTIEALRCLYVLEQEIKFSNISTKKLFEELFWSINRPNAA